MPARVLAGHGPPRRRIESLERARKPACLAGRALYLHGLRCPDGSTPLTQGLPRRHSDAGRLIEGFRVRCVYLNHEVEVYFDRAHPGHVEMRAVPGFALAGPDPRRIFARPGSR